MYLRGEFVLLPYNDMWIGGKGINQELGDCGGLLEPQIPQNATSPEFRYSRGQFETLLHVHEDPA
jgi:hypothetical protein